MAQNFMVRADCLPAKPSCSLAIPRFVDVMATSQLGGYQNGQNNSIPYFGKISPGVRDCQSTGAFSEFSRLSILFSIKTIKTASRSFSSSRLKGLS